MPRWTFKRLIKWLEEKFGIKSCRETVRKVLKNLGFSGKKARKLLNKAHPQKRAEFLEKLECIFAETLKSDLMLVYIDEAHICLDTDQGYGWSIKGERFWVSSSSPGRTKVSFYGVYLYNLAQVRFFPYEQANGFNSIEVLQQLRAEFPTLKLQLSGMVLLIIVPIWLKQLLQNLIFTSNLCLLIVLTLCQLNIFGNGCAKMSLIRPAMSANQS